MSISRNFSCLTQPFKAWLPVNKSKSFNVKYIGNEKHQVWLKESDQLVKEVVQRSFDLKASENESIVIKHSNPFNVELESLPATQIYSRKNGFGLDASKGKHRGFHGTSLMAIKRIGGIDQIFDRVFDPIGKRIYFDSVGVATGYALKHNLYDAGGSGWGNTQRRRAGTLLENKKGKYVLIEQPVLLAISSDEQPKLNDPVLEGQLHKHHYFPGNAPVYIDAMWLLHHDINPFIEGDGGVKDQVAKVGMRVLNKMAALTQRTISNTVAHF